MGTRRREAGQRPRVCGEPFTNHLLSPSPRAGDCHSFRPGCELQESSLCKLSCLGLFLRARAALPRPPPPRGCHRLVEQEGGPGAGEWAVACGGWVTMGCRPPGGNAGGPRGASVSGCCRLSECGAWDQHGSRALYLWVMWNCDLCPQM